MVATPARHGQPERRAADAGTCQHAVAAPGQTAAEPAQAFIVQLAHGMVAQQLHLQGGDTCLRVLKLGWRNLCHLQGRLCRQSALCIGLHHGLHKCHGCMCGVACSGRQNQLGRRHMAIIATCVTASVSGCALGCRNKKAVTSCEAQLLLIAFRPLHHA